jgi:hypothetical protein
MDKVARRGAEVAEKIFGPYDKFKKNNCIKGKFLLIKFIEWNVSVLCEHKSNAAENNFM